MQWEEKVILNTELIYKNIDEKYELGIELDPKF